MNKNYLREIFSILHENGRTFKELETDISDLAAEIPKYEKLLLEAQSNETIVLEQKSKKRYSISGFDSRNKCTFLREIESRYSTDWYYRISIERFIFEEFVLTDTIQT